MADVNSLQGLLNAYGIAVRAGAITPCQEDEAYFRDLFDLPSMSSAVVGDWKKSGGVRNPITLAQSNDDVEPKNNQEETEGSQP